MSTDDADSESYNKQNGYALSAKQREDINNNGKNYNKKRAIQSKRDLLPERITRLYHDILLLDMAGVLSPDAWPTGWEELLDADNGPLPEGEVPDDPPIDISHPAAFCAGREAGRAYFAFEQLPPTTDAYLAPVLGFITQIIPLPHQLALDDGVSTEFERFQTRLQKLLTNQSKAAEAFQTRVDKTDSEVFGDKQLTDILDSHEITETTALDAILAINTMGNADAQSIEEILTALLNKTRLRAAEHLANHLTHDLAAIEDVYSGKKITGREVLSELYDRNATTNIPSTTESGSHTGGRSRGQLKLTSKEIAESIASSTYYNHVGNVLNRLAGVDETQPWTERPLVAKNRSSPKCRLTPYGELLVCLDKQHPESPHEPLHAFVLTEDVDLPAGDIDIDPTLINAVLSNHDSD